MGRGPYRSASRPVTPLRARKVNAKIEKTQPAWPALIPSDWRIAATTLPKLYENPNATPSATNVVPTAHHPARESGDVVAGRCVAPGWAAPASLGRFMAVVRTRSTTGWPWSRPGGHRHYPMSRWGRYRELVPILLTNW